MSYICRRLFYLRTRFYFSHLLMRPEVLLLNHDTIVAPISAAGVGAVSLIRVSGEEAFHVCNQLFTAKNLAEVPSHTVHFGVLRNPKTRQAIDEVLMTVFRNPHSFTGENVVEIACHGSPFIVQEIIAHLVACGARMAQAGEFTRRAFLNGKFDLAQAEAVADLIAADTAAARDAALHQMRGGFSQQIRTLREKLIHFASLIELELDFGEEDVEFADRDDLRKLIAELQALIMPLISSFAYGNVIKNGVATVIAGKPNAGKSTLLNALFNEEKAIVSEIAGTTRDFIEDELTIEGIAFRFIDTAGLRESTQDKIEAIGIERTKSKMQTAALILYLFDLSELKTPADYETQRDEAASYGVPFLMVGNKYDHYLHDQVESYFADKRDEVVLISAKEKLHLDLLKKRILEKINIGEVKTSDTVVTNARHHEALVNTQASLVAVIDGLNRRVTGDFLAMDIRHALHHLGSITGEITHEDLLDNIFSKFCIGK